MDQWEDIMKTSLRAKQHNPIFQTRQHLLHYLVWNSFLGWVLDQPMMDYHTMCPTLNQQDFQKLVILNYHYFLDLVSFEELILCVLDVAEWRAYVCFQKIVCLFLKVTVMKTFGSSLWEHACRGVWPYVLIIVSYNYVYMIQHPKMSIQGVYTQPRHDN